MSSVGVSAYLANSWLDTLRNVPFSAPITAFQLHLGVPGAAGTSNPSAVTTRVAATFTAGSSGSVTFTGLPPVWTMTTDETPTHVSVWTGLSGDGGAHFLISGVINAPAPVAAGDVFALTSCTLTFESLAS